jgi:NAD(P)-dependent dehydrogenase (short-subunit alcohol dehydrogenase family)
VNRVTVIEPGNRAKEAQGAKQMSDKAMLKLEGKSVIITGASSGVGKASAELFVQEGARVGLIARREDHLSALVDELGPAAIYAVADIADDKQVATAVSHLADGLGGIDVLVNSAGIDGPAPLEALTPEIWRRQIDVNLSGTFYVAREAALRMRRDGSKGAIINLGSELGLMGMGLYVHYCASKFGVVGLTKALAAELAPDIRVNCICPGPIDTPMMDAELEWFPDPAATRIAAIARVPMQRFATPEEVARAILFFAADAPFATGSVFSLDGGTTAV